MNRLQESGNILFLILIVTALFAALSFAVVSASRNEGGTGGSEETALLDSSSEIQYIGGLRGAAMRMIISGVAAEELEFNPPQTLDDCTSPERCIFHTAGGAAIYQRPAPSVMANGLQGTWYFSGDIEVEHLGLSTSGSFAGNEIAAFLPGIARSVCERFNRKLGIMTMPVFDDTALSTDLTSMDHSYLAPAGETIIGPSSPSLMTAGSADDLPGRSEGCYYENQSGQYVYYQVIIER